DGLGFLVALTAAVQRPLAGAQELVTPSIQRLLRDPCAARNLRRRRLLAQQPQHQLCTLLDAQGRLLAHLRSPPRSRKYRSPSCPEKSELYSCTNVVQVITLISRIRRGDDHGLVA